MFNFRKKLKKILKSLKKENGEPLGFFTRTISGYEIKIRNSEDYFYALGIIKNKIEYMMSAKERQEVDELVSVVSAYIQKDLSFDGNQKPALKFTASLDASRNFLYAIAPDWTIINISYDQNDQIYRCKLISIDGTQSLTSNHRQSMEAAILHAAVESATQKKYHEEFLKKQEEFKHRHEEK